MEQEALWDVGQDIIAGTNPPETTAASKLKLQRTAVPTYYCPTRRQVHLYKDRAKTDYAGNAGSGTAVRNGVMVRTYPTTRINRINLADILDGTSNTMAVAESRLHLAFIEVAAGSCCSDNEDGYTGGHLDESNRRGDLPPGPDLHRMSDPPSLADNHFGSSHPGGLQTVMADGSVRFVRFTVSASVFLNSSVRNDGKSATINNL